MICPHCERDTDVVPSYRENAAAPVKPKAEKKSASLKDHLKVYLNKFTDAIRSFRPLARDPFVLGIAFFVLLAIVLGVPGYFVGTLVMHEHGFNAIGMGALALVICGLLVFIGGLMTRLTGETVKDLLGIE
jgi:hypothetical protein